ncbi:MAG: Lrp/AsnC family transcriptional regulator [Dehalococcoidia bacterium]|nr:Lrp/AsnC family transcriptional regulator [Dehalococcoidia bacterium]
MNNKAISPRMDYVYDELDLMLVRELEVDARQTTRNLAAKLGVSITTVTNRIRKMVDTKAIAFCTISDPPSLGYEVRVVLGIKTTPGTSTSVAKDLARCRNVQTTSLTTGRYDVVVYALLRNNQDLLDWVSGELGQIANIIAAEQMIILKLVKNSYMYLRGDTTLREEIAPRCLDESELKLIQQLELSPRESISDLGEKIGMSRQTTAKKLKALLEEKIIRVVSMANLPAFGFVAGVYVFLRVKLDRIVSVAHTLTADTRISDISIITGRFNLMLHMTFRSVEEMSRFLTGELGSIPGVIDQETMIQIGRAHLSFRLIR